jgi:hypothetical protein
VELIGAKLPSINKAEDRELFKQAMKKIGLKTPPSGTVETWEDALKARRAAAAKPGPACADRLLHGAARMCSPMRLHEHKPCSACAAGARLVLPPRLT